MQDILYEAALKYEGMLNKGYSITLGRKGKTYNIELRFNKSDFFHLVGLQHLTDITFSSKNKERVYKDILKGKVTENQIKKSIFYEKYYIFERIIYLKRLEEMLDSNKCVFLINQKEYIKYTKIIANYLCEYHLPETQNESLYLFSIKSNNPKLKNECLGCSFFKKHSIDYTKGTSETKLLLNTKITNIGNVNEKRVELFRRPNYV